MREIAAVGLAILLLGPVLVTIGPVASAQRGGETTAPSSMTRAEVLQGLNELPAERSDYPSLGVARYLALSRLQQEPIPAGDVEAAAGALVAMEEILLLSGEPQPQELATAREQLESSFRPVNATIDRVDGPSAETWRTVRHLLGNAVQSWGTALGERVLELAREQGQDQRIQDQLAGFDLAAEVFRAAEKPGRAEAAQAQRAVLEREFNADMERADRISSRVEELAENPPGTMNLIGGILWYQDAGQVLEDVPQARSIYNVYGIDQDRMDVGEARADLASTRASVRSSILSVLVPLHVAIAAMAAGTVHVVQRWERDVEDVMLGTEIALLRGMQG